MKQIVKISALLAIAAMAGACTKEYAETALPLSGKVPVTFNVEIDDAARLTIADGKFSWNSGDNVAICQYYYGSALTPQAYSVLSTTDSGASASFKGEVGTPLAGSNWYAFFPGSVVTSFSFKYSKMGVNFPTVQTGRASDLGSCYLMAISGLSKVETPSKQAKGTSLDGISLTTTKKPTKLSPVIKLNVPSSLNVTSIKLRAKAATKQLKLSGSFKNYFRIANEAFIDDKEAVDAKDYILVERGGEVISGDVYICMLPDTRVSGKLSDQDIVLSSSADTLEFTFSNDFGDMRVFKKGINDRTAEHPALTNETISNFGNIPASFLPNFKCSLPSMSSKADGENYYTQTASATFELPAGKALGDITYGVEYSYNAGKTWSSVVSTNGAETAGIISFSASLPSKRPAGNLSIRTFAYVTADPSARGISPCFFALDPVIISDDGKYFDFYYSDGTDKDYVVGAEYSTDEGASWTGVAIDSIDTRALSETAYDFKGKHFDLTKSLRYRISGTVPQLSLVRAYAYHKSRVDQKVYSVAETVPDFQLVFNFTDGTSSFSSSSESYDSGATGVDFTTGNAAIEKKASFPKTTFLLTNSQGSYPVNVYTGSQSSARSYAFKLDGTNGLCSNKLRVAFKGLSGKKLVSMYSRNGEANKAFTLIVTPNSSNQQYTTPYYDCVRVKDVAAGSKIQYGSDSNGEQTWKIVMNFVCETKSSIMTSESLSESGKYSW